MPNKQNVETLATIKEELKDISAMWIVDYRGLTVKEIQELRRNIRESGAKMTVWKNTIMKLAMDELKLPDLGEVLTGPSAFVVAPEDPVGSAKAIRDFAKKNEALEIKGGIMDGEFVDVDGVKAVAALPSREEVYAQIASMISGVARGLATAINGVPRGIAQTVSAVAEQKPADAA